jgi:hypothetical protein
MDTAYAIAGIIGMMSVRETISFVIKIIVITEIIKAYTILSIILLDSDLSLLTGISRALVPKAEEAEAEAEAEFSLTLI